MASSTQDQPVEGRFVGTQHRFPVRVYFEDTDLSGVVYHANYLRFMERARSDMLRLAGIDQRGFNDAGHGAYAVSALSIAYRAPAKLDDAPSLPKDAVASALVTAGRRSFSVKMSAAVFSSPALKKTSMFSAPNPSMSIAPRDTKWRSRSTAWAGQISSPVQRRRESSLPVFSFSSRVAGEPQTGQTCGKS